MRNPQNVQVDEVILHILDSRQNQLQLSEIPIPRGQGDARIFDYFRSRIEDSAGDSGARPAQFRDLTGASASLCRGMLDGTLTLVRGSQELATKLFGILQKNRSIAPGNLAVCRYQATGDGTTESCLALLKIDPTEALRPVVTQDQAGRQLVTLDIETDVFPTLGERLQKCALVRQLDPRPEDFDLLLVDRQKRTAEGPEVARFFTEDFLEAELAFDSRRSTERFYRGLILAQNLVRSELSDRQQGRLERLIQGVLSQERVDVDGWLDQVGLPKKAMETLREQLAPDQLPTREFEIDRDYADTVVQWRRFRGDHDLKLEVPADQYGKAGQKKLVEVEKIDRPPVGPPYFQITIRTRTWTEKP